jgi:ribosome-associated toxin RatA of RatAB toxin-antitoxin module
VRAITCSLVTLLVLSSTARAADDIDVFVERMDDGYHITAVAHTHAPIERAWAVLTDFNRLAEFVPDMRSSRVISADDQPIRIEQRGVAHALLFEREVSVTLAVTVSPMQNIRFRSIDGNLRTLSGEWRLRPQGGGCRLEYSAISDPGFWTPPFIGSALVRSQVREQIQGVVTEIQSSSR